MANRRMVAIRIIDSAKFLKMPISTQALYFHLVTRSDDDGVVEAFNIMRMAGSTEDDLRVLKAKGYITILNEDLVTYINDWEEHNLIRPDRKIDSMYKDLLVQMIPDAKLIEKRPRADAKKMLNIDNGQTMDRQWTDNGQHRLGKDMLREDSISNVSVRGKTHTQKHKHGEYKHIILTDEQHQKLTNDFGIDKVSEYIKKVDEYCQQYGKSYKDYNLTIRKWINGDNNKTKKQSSNPFLDMLEGENG